MQAIAVADRDDADAGERDGRAEPGQPEKRSPSNAIAMMAVKIGLTLMMKPAAPAETVSSPKLSIDRVERDEDGAAKGEAPQFVEPAAAPGA